jgi:hypothetical protein
VSPSNRRPGLEKRQPAARGRMRRGERGSSNDAQHKHDRKSVVKLRASIPFHVFPLFGAEAVI